MQIGSGFNASAAMDQVAKSTEIMNNLNRTIVDAVQDTSQKFLRVSAEARVAAKQNETRFEALA
jgi:hypothetical protein